MRRSFSWWLGMFAALAGAPAAAIGIGQKDDFQTETLQGWTGGSTPVNVATGGPAGSSDRYLEIDAADGNLGAFNDTQWAGNYLGAGVTALRLDVNNFGPSPVALRISVFNSDRTTAFTSMNEIALAAGSGWISVEFALSEAELERTVGSATLAQTLSSVNRLLIRHDPDPISEPRQMNPVTAVLGIDNITAVPEPDPVLLVMTGLTLLGAIRRRRRESYRSALF